MSGRYVEAKQALAAALAAVEDTFPQDDPTITTLQSDLALVLQSLGELGEARHLLYQALAQQEGLATGPPHHHNAPVDTQVPPDPPRHIFWDRTR